MSAPGAFAFPEATHWVEVSPVVHGPNDYHLRTEWPHLQDRLREYGYVIIRPLIHIIPNGLHDRELYRGTSYWLVFHGPGRSRSAGGHTPESVLVQIETYARRVKLV